MKFSMDSQMQFPLVELSLNQGETVYIQRGSMVYHTPNVSLNTQLNASGSGLGRFVKAVGRSMVSGESTFITQAVAESDNGNLVVITYGASENAYSKLSDEFKTVLDSFELK